MGRRDSWELDTILAGILETQQPIIQFATTIIDEGKEVAISTLPINDDEPQSATPIKRKKPTDEEIADSLNRHKGDRKEVAKELGIDPIQIDFRISRAPKSSPLYNRRKPNYSDSDIAETIRKAKGDIRVAAKTLGYTPTNIQNRISVALKGSPLFGLEIKKGVSQRVTNDQIAEALERLDGDKKLAAVELNITVTTINNRIRAAEDSSPLFKYRQRPAYTDHRITIALSVADRNIGLASIELGMSRQAIRERILNAAGDSPLALFKDLVSGGILKPEFSDTDIAKAIESSGGSIAKAAEKLGINSRVLYQRIRRAEKHSPLVKYKDLKRGRKPKYTDKEIAIAIEAAGGNKAKAARALQIATTTIYNRIEKAAEGSPLLKFR